MGFDVDDMSLDERIDSQRFGDKKVISVAYAGDQKYYAVTYYQILMINVQGMFLGV